MTTHSQDSGHRPTRRRIDVVLLTVLIAATLAVLVDFGEPDDPEPWLVVGFLAALWTYLSLGAYRLVAAIRRTRHTR